MGCLIVVLVCLALIFFIPLVCVGIGALAVLLEIAIYIAPIALVVLLIKWIFDSLSGDC